MLRRLIIIILTAAALVGCREATPVPTRPAVTAVDDAESHVDLVVEEVELAIVPPADWEAYSTDYGIVLAEHSGSMEEGGAFDGMLVHIFVPSIDDFVVPAVEGTNTAQFILNQVVRRPSYIGRSVVSEPTAIQWGEHDASYYLLNNGDGYLTLLLAVAMERPQRLVVASISTPADEASRIRTMLPEIFETFTVNGEQLSAAVLDNLPDPLVFPMYSGDEMQQSEIDPAS